MAVGDLSEDQLRFAQRVSAGTGLDPRVVTSWIGTESGWNTYKASHNYLNIGPGRTYESTDQAADAVIGLVRGSSLYSGIVASAVQGPAAQIEAIGSSKWGTEKKTLSDVFANLTGIRVNRGGTLEEVDYTLPDWIPGLGGKTVPTSPGEVLGSISDDLGKVVSAGITQLTQSALSLLFSAAAFGLIGVGVYKLATATGAKAKGEKAMEGVGSAKSALDQVGTAVSLIPTPQTKAAGGAAKVAKAL